MVDEEVRAKRKAAKLARIKKEREELAVKLKHIQEQEAAKPKKKQVRGFNDEMKEFVCEQIALGMSLRQICRENDWLPTMEDIIRKRIKDPAFHQKYTLARIQAMETNVERTFDIAKGTEPGSENMDSHERRLWIDTIKWAAGKLDGRYGDRVALTGADGGAIQMEARRVDVAQLEDDEREMLEQTMRRLIESQAK